MFVRFITFFHFLIDLLLRVVNEGPWRIKDIFHVDAHAGGQCDHILKAGVHDFESVLVLENGLDEYSYPFIEYLNRFDDEDVKDEDVLFSVDAAYLDEIDIAVDWQLAFEVHSIPMAGKDDRFGVLEGLLIVNHNYLLFLGI